MSVSHEPWLVGLSLVVAFQGSYVGLSLAVQVGKAEDPRRRVLLAGAALTLALAIWSMHFVGMLAARLPVAVDFLVLPTLLSFLVCVLVVGIAVFAASNGRLTPVRLGLSALVMGAGICSMHYLGMYALHASTAMLHDPVYVTASFLVAINAAGLALWLCFGGQRRPPLVASALVLALAISVMHYTSMAGVSLLLKPLDHALRSPSLSPATLAIVVACVAFLVSGLFLLTLVPERGEKRHSLRGGEMSSEPPSPSDLTTEYQQEKACAFNKTLPVERDGVTVHINTQDVVAVQADAHYSQLFDGTRMLFCPLAISEVERLLDPKQFCRVHRSHIVNLARVSGYRRVGDSGVLAMDGDEPHQVPVSRARWSRIKAVLSGPTESPAGTSRVAVGR